MLKIDFEKENVYFSLLYLTKNAISIKCDHSCKLHLKNLIRTKF